MSRLTIQGYDSRQLLIRGETVCSVFSVLCKLYDFGVITGPVRMPITKFAAFYTSPLFWAGSKVNFDDRTHKDWFHDQMAEEVSSKSCDSYMLRVFRDGRVEIRIEALEEEIGQDILPGQLQDTVRRWGKYLDYLNTFYLLLDSSTIETHRWSYFNLYEITNQDAFRVRYEDGKWTGESGSRRIGSIYETGRYEALYISGIPIENDPRIMARQVVPLDAIEHSFKRFDQVVASPGLEKRLATFAKSLSEYKIGNYETSIILSWFITEEAISHLWITHIDGLNREFEEGRKRINRERRDYLTGRDFPTSLVSNLLELWNVLPNQLFQDIDAVRRFRNKIVHTEDFEPSADEAQLGMQTARAMIERLWGFNFVPNTGYSVPGLV